MPIPSEIQSLVNRLNSDEKTLDELLDLAKDFEQQALSLYERATEIDEKWRGRLESKRIVAIQKSNSSQD